MSEALVWFPFAAWPQWLLRASTVSSDFRLANGETSLSRTLLPACPNIALHSDFGSAPAGRSFGSRRSRFLLADERPSHCLGQLRHRSANSKRCAKASKAVSSPRFPIVAERLFWKAVNDERKGCAQSSKAVSSHSTPKVGGSVASQCVTQQPQVSTTNASMSTSVEWHATWRRVREVFGTHQQHDHEWCVPTWLTPKFPSDVERMLGADHDPDI